MADSEEAEYTRGRRNGGTSNCWETNGGGGKGSPDTEARIDANLVRT